MRLMDGRALYSKHTPVSPPSLAVELCVLLVFWLSKDKSNAIGASPREALSNFPEIRNVLEAELADRLPSGRIPRAIMGRYLSYLFFFGEHCSNRRARARCVNPHGFRISDLVKVRLCT